ncbi:MAG: reverse transcriptase-like protein, partial [Corynebacterium matruchotii]
MKLVIEADGGSRGNPGIAGSCTVIYEADGTTVVRKLAYVVGTATNNVAEYHALYNGLCVAQQLGATDISVRMDSKLVVEQMSGRWKIKHPDMRELALKCQKILRTLHSAEFTWVPRRQNAAADALANLAMDAGATAGRHGIRLNANFTICRKRVVNEELVAL